MITMVILGYGNVGNALCAEFSKYDTIQLYVYNRTPVVDEDKRNGIIYVSDLTRLPDADLYVMAISDDQISEFSKKLPV